MNNAVIENTYTLFRLIYNKYVCTLTCQLLTVIVAYLYNTNTIYIIYIFDYFPIVEVRV